MITANQPVSITIPHRLGRAEAKRRIERGLDAIAGELAQYVSSLDYRWTGDRLDFRAAALRQTIVGRLDVAEAFVRIEFALPRLLHLLAGGIAGRIERRGAALLDGPPG